jgi:hypothetical protein
MKFTLSPKADLEWKNALLILCGLLVVGFIHYGINRSRRKAIRTLQSLSSQEVTSFKIHPDETYTDDFHDAIEFIQDKQLVTAFFQTIPESRSYRPQHDRALAQWGMQIRTNNTTLRIGCYIPDLRSGVVGLISSEDGSGHFQSRSLLRWYQKYGHYWHVGHYQHEQYIRVMSVLKSLHAQAITSFTLLPGVPESSENKETHAFTRETERVAEFVQALEDVQFAASIQKEFIPQWGVQIDTNATTVTLECVLSANDPTVVIGLIDSHKGYTYFQSQKLFQWYQKYKERE